jgi:hypothetical protein
VIDNDIFDFHDRIWLISISLIYPINFQFTITDGCYGRYDEFIQFIGVIE